MKKKRKRPSTNRPGPGVKRQEMSRRTLLAALGVSAALPATLRAADPKNPDEVFDAYWEEARTDIAARDAATGKERERLEVRIEFRRQAVMKTLDRSSYVYNATCPKVTPVPSVVTPSKK